MDRILKILSAMELFCGIEENDIENMLKCLTAAEKTYHKNEFIIMAGSRISSAGILISGSAQIVREDAEGGRAILSDLEAGDLFGEAYAAAGTPEVPISVIASADCRVLWIPFEKITLSCSNSCAFHSRVIRNMLRVIAEKNVLMNEKMRLLSCKTTREKLLTYLRDFAERTGRNQFKIPFDREQLADFLSVDRSAMSRELGKLKGEGILAFHKNEFELLQGRR